MPEGHKCLNNHGHTFVCRLWVAGWSNTRDRSIVVEYDVLDAAIRERIHARLDHKDLNAIGAAQEQEHDALLRTPSIENLARWFYCALADALPDGVYVSRITIDEDGTYDSGVVEMTFGPRRGATP